MFLRGGWVSGVWSNTIKLPFFLGHLPLGNSQSQNTNSKMTPQNTKKPNGDLYERRKNENMPSLYFLVNKKIYFDHLKSPNPNS